MLFKKFSHLKIGTRLFLSFSVVLLLILVSMSYLAIYFVVDFGEFSSTTNEDTIRQQTYSFLSRITHEQSMRYENTFRKIAGASAMLAQNTGYLLENDPFYRSAPLKAVDNLVWDETARVFTNDSSDTALVVYDKSTNVSPETAKQLQTLSLIDPQLEGIIQNYPETLSAYILTATGIRRYYPNLHNLDNGMTPVQYDMMNTYFYGAACPTFNPEKKSVWTRVYPDDAGRGLIITASTPIYNAKGTFIGAAGIDVTIKTIVNEILGAVTDHTDMPHMIPFLIDDVGVILAMDQYYLEKLGLVVHAEQVIAPGTVLVHSLLDSRLKEVRNIARSIVSKEQQVSEIVLDDVPYFIASHSMPSTGWRFGIVVPEAAMLASVYKTRDALTETVHEIKVNFTLLSVVFLLLGLLLMSLLLRNVVKPIKHLTHAAGTVKKGNLDTKVDIKRKDEIGELAESFNSMVKGLQKAQKIEKAYTQTLEQEVQERTIEIKAKNSELEKTLSSLKNEMQERMHAESERIKLSMAVEQTAESVIIMAADGTIQYVNPAGVALFGYNRNNGKEYNPFAYRDEAFSDAKHTEIWDTITSGTVWKGELNNSRNDGAVSELDVTISPIRTSDGTIAHFVAVCRDISNEKKLQKTLRQAQKMEAIGTLAGGIAHDFNNILTAISGYTELSIDKIDKKTKTYRHLREVLAASDRARDLVQQILTFSRQKEQESRPVKLIPIVKETVKFLKASLPSTISIVQNFTTDNDLVLSDPTQLHQVIMNLCANAKDAIGENGGILEIYMTETEIADEGLSGHLNLESGSYLLLSISDNGCGMDKNIIEKIFDPFFTTKEQGKGTGLGLSVVHGIVTGCGGDIRVYSEPGKGTRFDVYLPSLKTHSDAPSTDTSETEVVGGNEHILVVDDEQQIIDMLGIMLENLGYRVTARNSSIEALGAFRDHPHVFDLIITDQTMPGLTGVELTQKVLEIRRDIPIILCTGFSEVINETKTREIGIRDYLLKPVIRARLARSIRNVLDGNDRTTTLEKNYAYADNTYN